MSLRTQQCLCNTLQHAVTRCNTLQHATTHCNPLQHTATRCNKLQPAATACNTLQHAATCCSTLQERLWLLPVPTATATATLQHAATRCNTLQHTTWEMLLLLQLPQSAAHSRGALCCCSSVSQRVTACYSVLQWFTWCIHVGHLLFHIHRSRCKSLQHTATHPATHCNTNTSSAHSRGALWSCCTLLQRVAVCCSDFHSALTCHSCTCHMQYSSYSSSTHHPNHCNTLQRTATHYIHLPRLLQLLALQHAPCYRDL